MPHTCIVPECDNDSDMPGISFHRLPLDDPVLLKEWLVKIRRVNTPITENLRVCGCHFLNGHRCGKNDISVIFSWTKPSRPPNKYQL